MPHDIMSVDLSLPDPAVEISPSPHKSKSSILSAMKEAGHSLVSSVKHAGSKGILSAMMAASSLLCLPHEAKAQATPLYLSYSSRLEACVPDLTEYPCGFGDVQFNVDTVTGAIGGTMFGQGIDYISNGTTFVDYLGFDGYQVTSWNGVTVASLTFSSEAVLSSAPTSLSGDTVYDVAIVAQNGTTEYGWSSEPGFWSVGLLPNPKTLGATSIFVGRPLGGGAGPLASAPVNPGDSSPGTGPGDVLSCSCERGDPINVATGNLFEQIVDYGTVGANSLGFTRYYNSLGSATPTHASDLGVNWRSTYDRYLRLTSGVSGVTNVTVERANGEELTFTLQGSVWTPDSDVDLKLVNTSGSTWTLTDHNDTVETYTVVGYEGLLQSAVARNGYTHTLAYNGSNQLQSVTDSYGRALNFTYSGNLLSTVTTPDGLTLTYGYNSSGTNPVNPATLDRLASVTYSTSPATSQSYLYGDTNLPFSLTGVVDEKGNQTSTWTYDDPTNRATSSQRGAGADLTSFTYNSDGTTTVTNALGVADTYTFSTLQGVPKVTGISRSATSTTAAATQSFGYDSNGYPNSSTDWNGNHTTYVNNALGNPTTINEAVGSTVARTTTISYDSTFVHEPHQIITPGLTSTFTYDGSGNPLTRTDLDTTTNSVPYSTGGQTRVTTWTWSATGQETSEKLPRTDVTAKTTYTYDATGALTQIQDALTHLTKITSHTGGGLPLTIVDPNSVTTTLVYDARLNLNTSTLATTAGNLVTTYTHDAANELTAVQLPDNSKLTYGYDTAHRLTTITDLISNSVNYTLDALGDKTLIQVKDSSGTVTQSHSGTFDALGRVLTDVGGMSQTTTYTWDKNSNVLTIAQPSPSGTITETWDALNRLATRVEPSPGGTTTFTFDAHDKLLSVKDATTHTTTYVNDGFSDRTQTVSPDSGTTVYHYDADRNLTQIVRAGSLTANLTWDALDRNLTVAYPSDSTLNVTRTYDQTGHGFGVGRLTSVTDQVGSLSNTYDERGNVTNESRVITSVGTLTTATTYDAASNISSITYPSTTLVSYTRDSMGRETAVTAKPPGGTVSNIATGVTYEPFGPVTGLTFGNGITGTYAYDADYRPTTRADKNGSTSITNLSYGYYANNSVHTITDSVNAANSQTLGYNAVDGITSAASGTGGYGTYAWTWDAVGNVKTQVINSTTTTFNLTSGTNKLASIVTGSTTETVTSTAAGNINTLKIGSTTQETLTYNQANQLASESTPGTAATYKYSQTGERLEKTVSGSNPVVFQYGQAARELLSENDLHSGQRADYVYLNGRPVGEVDPVTKNLYFTHTDRLGTPQRLTDSTKTVDWNGTYAPFGNTVMFSGTLVNQSLRLPGQYFDPETTMNHNGFRDYAGAMTRYVETDPIGLAGGMNTFQYVKGNPLKYIDPKGLFQITVTVGEGLAVLGTIGYNGGQWNIGVYGGVGQGLSVSVDPTDTGCERPKFQQAWLAEGKIGLGPNVDAFAKITPSESEGSIGLNILGTPLNVQLGSKNGLVQKPNAGYTFGESTFFGTGYTRYYDPSLRKPTP